MLMGVVEHAGSMAGGHYTSFAARDPAWRPPARTDSPAPTAPPSKATAAAGQDGACNGVGAASHRATTGPAAEEGAGGAHARASRGLDAERLIWFKQSDSRVSASSWEAVAACEAYMLMYVRVS